MAQSLKDLVEDAKARVETIEPEAAHASDALILDVREPGELEKSGHIAGALSVPRGLLEWKADPGGDAAELRLTNAMGTGPVHVLCAAGGRATLAADTLRRMGYEAKVIRGGLNGWKAAGLPVED